jgi:tetratricopeptide (TPR) repeat protein
LVMNMFEGVVCVPLSKLRQHLSQGEHVLALQEAERVIQTGEVSGLDLVRAHRGAALAHYHLRNVYAAVKQAEYALQLVAGCHPCPDTWELTGKLRYELGEYYLTLGDIPLAHEHLLSCLTDLDRYHHIPELAAKLHHNLALVHWYRKEHDAALDAFHLAAARYQETGQMRQVMEVTRAIIWCYLDRSDPDAARPYLEAIAAYLADNADAELATAYLVDLAYYHRQSGNLKASLDCCAEVLAPGRPGVDDRLRATACVITGENALDAGRYEEAHLFAGMAMECAIQARHPYLMNMSSALRRRIHAAVPGLRLD